MNHLAKENEKPSGFGAWKIGLVFFAFVILLFSINFLSIGASVRSGPLEFPFSILSFLSLFAIPLFIVGFPVVVALIAIEHFEKAGIWSIEKKRLLRLVGVFVLGAAIVFGVLSSLIAPHEKCHGLWYDDAGQLMSKALKELQAKGTFSVLSPRDAYFSRGSILLPKNLLTDVPLRASQLTFYCADESDGVCSQHAGASTPIVIDTNTSRLTVNSKVQAYFVACTDGKNYCIAVGKDEAAVSDACIAACHLA